jgi:RNA polymerase sigma-70 factor (ECF subfamily)
MTPDFDAQDFELARAALQGLPAAQARVIAVVDGVLPQLSHLRLTPDELQDVRSGLLEGFFSPQHPRLARYSGRGSLQGWLRVVLTRDALTGLKGRRRLSADDDAVLLGRVDAPAELPELNLLRERFRGGVTRAFRKAVASLEVRERNLLKQHYLDELTLEELATLYRVHRASVARWLSTARARVLAGTQRELVETLQLAPADAESLVRALHSRIDLSAGMFLVSGPS